MKQKWIGFIEHNDHEGESFGFYVPSTPEYLDGLKKVEKMFEKFGVLGGKFDGEGFEMDYENPYTDKDLDMIELGANNGYMSRCNIIHNPALILGALQMIEDENDIPYKGHFKLKGESYDMRKS